MYSRRMSRRASEPTEGGEIGHVVPGGRGEIVPIQHELNRRAGSAPDSATSTDSEHGGAEQIAVRHGVGRRLPSH